MKNRNTDITIRVLNGETSASVAKSYNLSGTRVHEIVSLECHKIYRRFPKHDDYYAWTLSRRRAAKTIFIYHLECRPRPKLPLSKPFKAMLY